MIAQRALTLSPCDRLNSIGAGMVRPQIGMFVAGLGFSLAASQPCLRLNATTEGISCRQCHTEAIVSIKGARRTGSPGKRGFQGQEQHLGLRARQGA